MSFEEKGTKVRIMDKEFRINCPQEKEQELFAAASYLDKQMRQIRHSGRVIGLDRVAIMAALNITHELINLKNKRPEEDVNSLRDRLQALQHKIDGALVADDKPYGKIETKEQILNSDDFRPDHEMELEASMDAYENESTEY